MSTRAGDVPVLLLDAPSATLAHSVKATPPHAVATVNSALVRTDSAHAVDKTVSALPHLNLSLVAPHQAEVKLSLSRDVTFKRD